MIVNLYYNILSKQQKQNNRVTKNNCALTKITKKQKQKYKTKAHTSPIPYS